MKRLTRRKFVGALLGFPLVAAAEAALWEPSWIRVRKLRVGTGKPAHRFVHFTDLHHKGDRKYLARIIETINGLSPDFVCFTGDIIEDSAHLPEALEFFSQLKSPLYGIPGNHDYWAHADFGSVAAACEKTGGRWLIDSQTSAANGRINLVGVTGGGVPAFKLDPARKNILLSHYPTWVEKIPNRRFDLILSGHSHGGQVRLPFYGPLLVPFGVGEFSMGFYETRSGPMYVNPGLGYFYLNVRLCCRPEITVFEV